METIPDIKLEFYTSSTASADTNPYRYHPNKLNRSDANRLFDRIIRPIHLILFGEIPQRNYRCPTEAETANLVFTNIDKRWLRSSSYMSLYLGLVRYMHGKIIMLETQRWKKRNSQKIPLDKHLEKMLTLDVPNAVDEAKEYIRKLGVIDSPDFLSTSVHTWLLHCEKEDPNTMGKYVSDAHWGINDFCRAEITRQKIGY